VKARQPVWTMTRFCPICEQGSCLAFIACPECSRLAIRCEEDGIIFLEPRGLKAVPPTGDPASAVPELWQACGIRIPSGVRRHDPCWGLRSHRV
jgi:hypothetical protein